MSIFSKVTSVVSNNSPAILMGLGLVGTVTTAVLTAKATPKAIALLESEDAVDSPLGYKARLVWPKYVPAVVSGIMTCACIIGSNTISTRRASALATAYAVADKALGTYSNKVVDMLGEKKDVAIRDAIAKDKVKENPNYEVWVTGNGDVLCYDAWSGRYFKSDIEKVRKAINDLNQNIIHDMWVSLNEYYSALGLPSVRMGDTMGWDPDRMIDPFYTSMLCEDGRPCLSIDHKNDPKPGPYTF